MDDLRPTEYPQPITRPSKTLEALPYRNNPYGNNPYVKGSIPPPPPAPITIEKVVEVKKYGPLKLVIILGCMLILLGLVGGYEIGRTDQTPSSQATPTGESADYQNGYNGGYTAGYNQGKQDGHDLGYNTGYTDGQNRTLLDIYDFLVKNSAGGNPCLKTPDQPD